MRFFLLFLLILTLAGKAEACAWPLVRQSLLKKTASYWSQEYVRLSADFSSVAELLDAVYQTEMRNPRAERDFVEVRVSELIQSQSQWGPYFEKYFDALKVTVNFDSVTAVQESIALRITLVNFMQAFNEELLIVVPEVRAINDAEDWEIKRAADRAKARMKIAAPAYLFWNRKQLVSARSDYRFSYAEKRLFYKLLDNFTRHSILEDPANAQIIMQYLEWGYLQSR